mmetsp:Transcript_81244/g.135913  ORF Transcript_81244/g.135913 Transcript_81244/m.135913 type:complete len:201 (+) Transcript_81244:505-1107(+)
MAPIHIAHGSEEANSSCGGSCSLSSVDDFIIAVAIWIATISAWRQQLFPSSTMDIPTETNWLFALLKIAAPKGPPVPWDIFFRLISIARAILSPSLSKSLCQKSSCCTHSGYSSRTTPLDGSRYDNPARIMSSSPSGAVAPARTGITLISRDVSTALAVSAVNIYVVESTAARIGFVSLKKWRNGEDDCVTRGRRSSSCV